MNLGIDICKIKSKPCQILPTSPPECPVHPAEGVPSVRASGHSDPEKRRPTVASVREHVERMCFTSVASTLVSEPRAGYPGRILALPRFRFQKVYKNATFIFRF